MKFSQPVLGEKSKKTRPVDTKVIFAPSAGTVTSPDKVKGKQVF